MNVHISKLTMLGVAVLASVGIASCGGGVTSALEITAENSNYVVPAEGSTENIVVKSGTMLRRYITTVLLLLMVVLSIRMRQKEHTMSSKTIRIWLSIAT